MTEIKKYFEHLNLGSSSVGRFDLHRRAMHLFPFLTGAHLDLGHYFECLFEAVVLEDNAVLSDFVVINLKGDKPKDFGLILEAEQLAPDQYLTYIDKDDKTHQRMRNTAKGAPNRTNKNLFYWWDYYEERGHLDGKMLIPKKDADMCKKLVKQVLDIPIEIAGLGESLREVIGYADKIKFQVPYYYDMPLVGGSVGVKALTDIELWFGNRVLLVDLKTCATFAQFFQKYKYERWHQSALYPEVVKGNGVELFADGILYLLAEKLPLGEKDDPQYRTKAFWIGHDPAKVDKLKAILTDYRQWQSEGGETETHTGWEVAREWRKKHA
ncbi:MAG: hypothetical protein GY757_19140 [bacterium]|nr:hypothetical protein [bacterium]